MDNEEALSQLKALLEVPGMLKVITAEHAHPAADIRNPTEEECAAHTRKVKVRKTAENGDNAGEEEVDEPITLKSPRHYVIHNVTGLAELSDGTVTARTDEGDWTNGYPVDVLNRLMEHRND